MAGQRLTDKTEATNYASDDLAMIVDVDDSTGSSVGTSKKITMDNVIYTKTINLDSSTLQGLSTAETIIAGETNYIMVPLSFLLTFNYVSSTETNKRNFYLGYTGVSTSKNFYQGTGLMHNQAQTTSYVASIGGGTITATATLDGRGIQCVTDNDYTNDMTLTIYATYKKLKI